MSDPKPCTRTDHGPTGSTILPKSHHHDHDGGYLAHARFPSSVCLGCRAGMALYRWEATAATPTPDPDQPDLFGGAS